MKSETKGVQVQKHVQVIAKLTLLILSYLSVHNRLSSFSTILYVVEWDTKLQHFIAEKLAKGLTLNLACMPMKM